ncbi:MAG: hypothetical protein N4A72_14605 [Bacteroidales bacterium]|jgi:hypothetical protein|nr:hypothetical protein [Bacteroidales bacterium]
MDIIIEDVKRKKRITLKADLSKEPIDKVTALIRDILSQVLSTHPAIDHKSDQVLKDFLVNYKNELRTLIKNSLENDPVTG